MKRLLIFLFIVSLLIIGYSYDQFAWCKKLILGEPSTHTIQQGEYLSQIAKKYYGDASYWRELALINRAPDCDVVFPGEEIVIPSFDVIKEIRKTRWLTKVNKYVKGQEEILAQLNAQIEDDMAAVDTDTPVEPQSLANASASEQLPVEAEEVA